MFIYGIGTDITECARIRAMLEKHGSYFYERIFSDWEIEYCQSQKQSVESFTGRWCVKEAILKALGTGWVRGIAWRDMDIRTPKSGPPYVLLGGGVLAAALVRGVTEIHVSISHCASHAVANAVAVCGEGEFPEERRFYNTSR
ncbi:MAG: holo-ACP synthase [Planctomycetia bacterium]|nr:holo-ACP synthase [Planctomycetia bacterium]